MPDKKITTTKEEIKEVMMETLAGFNVSFLEPAVKDLKNEIKGMKENIQNLEGKMATKSFITDQIADLKGEFVIEMKKEDEKLERITDKLGDKKIFNAKDIEEIKSIKVFAKVA